jgi:hypothetical protein
MTGNAQHYIPAGLIGRFGRRVGNQWRTARIAARRVGESAIRETSARNVGFEIGLYRLKNPPQGLDADVVDHIWTVLEQQLPGAIESLLRGQVGLAEVETLLFYVASCAVRHPDVFQRIAGAHQASSGLPEPIGDLLQILRLESIQATLSQIRAWRWRVFDCSPEAEGLIINDKGFCYLGDASRNTTGLFLPLRPNLGVLGSLDQSEGEFVVRRRLTAKSVRSVNHALWLEAPREIYGHPDARDTLRQLDHPPVFNRLGPFMWKHGGGWFD